MKKRFAGVAMLLCLTLVSAAGAAGVTLRTFTPFADTDFAAQAYMDLVTVWEEETGNLAEDYSGTPDEAFAALLKEKIAAGAADVVVLPAGFGFTERELVRVDEMLAAAPNSGVRAMPAMAEADGSLLLSPVRLNWETLYVNTDVFARCGLPVPNSFDSLVASCVLLAQQSVLPMANALCEWPEIVLDCAALIGAPAQVYGSEQSLEEAKDVLSTFVQVGAFGEDPWNLSDAACEEAFLSGDAAMRFDSDSLAQMVARSRWDNVCVLPLFSKDGQTRTAVVGTPSFGIGITRSCWQDPARREAALTLVSKLLAENGQLCTEVEGGLGASIAELTASAENCTGLLYDLNADYFDSWAEGVVASLMGQ